jgi:hypothetical protein
MIVPTVKTLITYTKGNESIRVLADIEMGDDKYAQIEYENDIEFRCPFEDDNSYRKEMYHVYGNRYEIVFYDYHGRPMYSIDVIVDSVLEFDGRIFILQETEYDMKEYDY